MSTSLQELSAALRRQQFYVVRMQAPEGIENPREYLTPHLHEHLLWLQEMESSGQLFVSGALADETGWDGSGLAIVRAPSRQAAQALADTEPFAKHGLRTNSVAGWQLNEGSITFTLNILADSFTVA
ncbi:YciI family protein [Streptomyces sp. NPDC005728]|uniref:YciI family protein n=1 Tax=Streptomyces sp. NPDC005728 TaxID=3157054 RepID=UPI0033E8CD44